INNNESSEDHNFSDRNCDNSELEKEESLINNAIEFMNKIMNKKTFSKTEKTHYTAVLYFFSVAIE
ncbi:2660_t:CDS:1, partial [Cetraspora pellucida]